MNRLVAAVVLASSLAGTGGQDAICAAVRPAQVTIGVVVDGPWEENEAIRSAWRSPRS